MTLAPLGHLPTTAGTRGGLGPSLSSQSPLTNSSFTDLPLSCKSVTRGWRWAHAPSSLPFVSEFIPFSHASQEAQGPPSPDVSEAGLPPACYWTEPQESVRCHTVNIRNCTSCLLVYRCLLFFLHRVPPVSLRKKLQLPIQPCGSSTTFERKLPRRSSCYLKVLGHEKSQILSKNMVNEKTGKKCIPWEVLNGQATVHLRSVPLC